MNQYNPLMHYLYADNYHQLIFCPGNTRLLPGQIVILYEKLSDWKAVSQELPETF